jgi:hypothetical protein
MVGKGRMREILEGEELRDIVDQAIDEKNFGTVVNAEGSDKNPPS